MRKLLGILFGFLIGGNAFAAEIDSFLMVKNSAFFTGLLQVKAPISPLFPTPFKFINPDFPSLKTRGYQFFKTSENLFIHFSGSGLLYALKNPKDSVLVFKRIDDTENFNYNIHAFVFSYNKDIYNMGGYGFWKSTGTLRKYNIKDLEWDAEPIKEEIHLPFDKDLCWFNPTTQLLYIPYQQIINSGVEVESDEDQFDRHVYRFNLKEKTWDKLGKTNQAFLDIVSKSTWKVPTETGLIVSHNNKVYLVNYEDNSLKVFANPSFTQSLERINDTYLKYYHNGVLHFLSGKTWKTDSIVVPLNQFKDADIKVWKKSKTGYAIGIAPVVLILAAAANRKREAKKKRAEVLESSQQKTPIPPSVKIKFNETERQLLKVLLDKSKQNDTTTISEINYALGIKDKNIGLQKKVRSDVMNSINEKFNFLQEDDTDLICNVRSQSDKRYFEYFIDKSNIELLEILLKEGE